MSERDLNSGGPGAPADSPLPTNTGEFRAAPDISASTAQFRAFAAGPGGEGEHAWSMRAPGRNIAALAGIVVVVAIVLVVLAFVVLGH